MLENTSIIQIHLFYPLLFFTIIISLGLITFIIFKFKDNGLFNNIFNKHTDEHIDITNKMESMHNKVIKVSWDSNKEKELHQIECMIKDINFKLDALTERVIYLENNQK